MGDNREGAALQRAFLREACAQLGPAQERLARRPEASLLRWLSEQQARCHDAGFNERFAAACPVPGVAAAAYAHQLSCGQPNLLAGIRFKGGSVALPFIDLLAWDQPLYEAAVWEAVLQRLRSHFAPFAAPFVRVRWPGREPPPCGRAREVDQFLLAGGLDSLVAAPPTSRLQFAPARDLAWKPSFEESFKAWADAAGPLADEVAPSTRADFETCLQTGAVVCAWHQGVWAGVAAAASADERVLSGYCVFEQFLAGSARGRGLGVELQAGLISALRRLAASQAVLWGTIHGSNGASVKTAQRCGREVVETWWFLEL